MAPQKTSGSEVWGLGEVCLVHGKPPGVMSATYFQQLPHWWCGIRELV